jgi:hypothetical protein
VQHNYWGGGNASNSKAKENGRRKQNTRKKYKNKIQK